MTTVYKVLGQVSSNISTLTTLYTVPAATSAVVSTITISDVGGIGHNFSVAIAVAGASDDPKQYLYGSSTAGIYMDAGDTFVATVGLTLAAGDVVKVRNITAGSSRAAFQLFGSEIS